MEMKIRFPGNKKVTAEFDGYTVVTDQPKESGGDGSAPAPFELFLASLGAKLYSIPLLILRSWREESNLQPMVYKTIALPLSYASFTK